MRHKFLLFFFLLITLTSISIFGQFVFPGDTIYDKIIKSPIQGYKAEIFNGIIISPSSALTENIIKTKSGTVIKVPIDTSPRCIGGFSMTKNIDTINLYYRELSDAYNTLGIPMNYDSAGKKYTLQSVGMFEIYIIKNNNKYPIDIEFLASDTLRIAENYNLYYLNPEKGTWDYIKMLNLTKKTHLPEGGKVSLDDGAVRILSDAYLKYPEYDTIKYRFDSLNFAERYKNLSYIRTEKIGLSHILPLQIKLTKGIKKEIWFEFRDNENFPELITFHGLKWVYAGTLDKKSFKQKYIKSKNWTDIRFNYDEKRKLFTIILKCPQGFDTLVAYPRFPSKKIDLSVSQHLYEVRYLDYTEKLKSIEAEFNKQLSKEKAKYEKTLEKEKDKVWNSFRKIISNDEEKQMTRKEWMEYYYNITGKKQQYTHLPSGVVFNFQINRMGIYCIGRINK